MYFPTAGFRHVLAAAIVMGCGGICQAQLDIDGVVNGAGVVMIEQDPELMRMSIQLSEEGKNVEEALARLKDRREAAILQLESLGAEKDSIKASRASLTAGQGERQRRVQHMIRQRSASRGKKSAKPAAAPVLVTVHCTLSAEWLLKVDSHEALLAFSHQIAAKVEAADLAGVNEPKQLTPEEEEVAEEMEEMEVYSSSEDSEPGKPTFLFVARITDEQRDKAMAEAFAKARQNAETQAKAAGGKLGKLKGVAGFMNEAESDFGGYSYQLIRRISNYRSLTPSAGTAKESEALEPGPIEFPINVTAEFELK